MRFVKLAVILASLPSCGSEPRPTSIAGGNLPRWEVSGEPLLHIGVLEGDEAYQFFRISGIARMGTRIVVASSGTRHLRYFSSEGAFLGQAGGRGEGPAEFQRLGTIHAISGDTLLAFDGTWRASYFDSAGTFLGSVLLTEAAGSTIPRDLWLYRRNLVDGIPPGRGGAQVKRLLTRLTPPLEEPWYWYVRFDSAGYAWVSDDLVPGRGRSDWTIVDTTGAAVARVTLPPEFEMFEATDDDVLGRWRDENRVEYVRIYALGKPPRDAAPPPEPRAAGPAAAPAAAPISPELWARVRGSARNLVTAQERYFADHVIYSANRHDIEMEVPEGLFYDFISASARGWLAIISGPELPVICGVAVGDHTPRGWREGVPSCAEFE